MQTHDHLETAASGFLPHGFCYLWDPALLWTHVSADFLIGAAYVVISVALALLVHRVRSDIPFSWVFVAFGLFIITCGLTHFMEIWTLWQPVYWLSGGIKVLTAIASVATAAAMPFTVPPVVATVRDARLARERELAEARANALEAQNELLKLALTEAELAHQSKSVFLRPMSHELRTPLNAIIGYSQLMEAGISGPVTEQQLHQLERVHRSAQHLLGLVEDVLTLSRGEAGVAPLAVTVVHLPALVDSALEMVEGAARAKGLQLVRGEVPDLTVRTDAGRLRQILLNLLSNAVKFTTEGNVTLSATRSRETVVFRVSDTGRGIAPEHLESVFDPFWQLEQTTNRSHGGGSGLGLAVSRQLARLLGGEVSVTSEPGRGSTFSLALPLDEIRSAGNDHPPAG